MTGGEKITLRQFLGVTACVVILLLPTGCRRKKPPLPPPPKVAVAQPVKRTVTDTLEFTGNTQAVNNVQLVARVPGNLDKVFFRDGQIVKKGQLLFLIQQEAYRARLEQVQGEVLAQQARLEFAQSQLLRYSNLLPKKAASQADVDNWRFQLDSAKANLKTAEANRDLARLDHEYTQITAPFTGRIDRRQQDPGNLVGSGANNSVLARLSQIDPIYVYFTVSDVDLARFMKSRQGLPGRGSKRKSPVFMGVTKEEGFPHAGHIDFAATNVTTTTGSLLMRGVFPNPTGRILPGLFARVQVPLDKRDALLVPDAAVANDQQGSYLLIVNGRNLVERRGVKTGFAVGSLRVIEEGLNGNEWVIVKGQLKAIPGSPVTPERETLAAEAGPSTVKGKE